jgi:serine protease Do
MMIVNGFRAVIAAAALVGLAPLPLIAQEGRGERDPEAAPSVVVIQGDSLPRHSPGFPEFGEFPGGIVLDGTWLGFEDRGFLGVVLGDDENRAVVKSVADDGPAAKAGIRAGDVIVSVNGTPVASAKALIDAIRAKRPGDRVEVVLTRGDKRETVTATLGGRPGGRMLRMPGTPMIPFAFGSHARLGVSVVELTDQLRAFFGVEDGKGALVATVEADSPAAKAGIRAGDVVVSVGERSVSSAMDVIAALRALEPGSRLVDVVVVRDRAKVTFAVTLEVPERSRTPSVWRTAPGSRFRL